MPSKQYRAIESTVTFKDSGGSAVLSANGLAAGAGRVSAQVDRGPGSLAAVHTIKAVAQWQATPAVGEFYEVWMFESDGTLQDGNVGTSDAALGSDKRRNGKFIGAVQCDVASANTNMIGTFENVMIMDRYYSMALWNAGSKAFTASANVSYIEVIPTPPEMQ